MRAHAHEDETPKWGASTMAEVVIELDLNRRSGVLASAIAALRKLPLNFQSQRLVESNGKAQLHLSAEGQVANLEDVRAAFATVRGVASVADVRVDGSSLAAARKPAATDSSSAERAVSSGAGTLSGSEAQATEPQPRVHSESDPAKSSESSRSPKSTKSDPADTGFDDEMFAQHVLVPTGGQKSKAGPLRRRRRLR